MFDIPETEEEFAIENAFFYRLSMLIEEKSSQITEEESDEAYVVAFHEGIDFALNMMQYYLSCSEYVMLRKVNSDKKE